MIRITANALESDYRFSLTQEGTVLLSGADWTELTSCLLQIGVHDPLSLVKAAEQWGAVDIHENENPSWIGG